MISKETSPDKTQNISKTIAKKVNKHFQFSPLPNQPWKPNLTTPFFSGSSLNLKTQKTTRNHHCLLLEYYPFRLFSFVCEFTTPFFWMSCLSCRPNPWHWMHMLVKSLCLPMTPICFGEKTTTCLLLLICQKPFDHHILLWSVFKKFFTIFSLITDA